MKPSRECFARIVFIAVLLLAANACTGRTRLFVAVTSDLTDLDEVRVRSAGPSGTTMESTGELTGPMAMPWPRTVLLRPGGASDEAVTVFVDGYRGGVRVMQRAVTTSFRPGEQRLLPILLCDACRTGTCALPACDPSNCGDVHLDPASLPSWSGESVAPGSCGAASSFVDAGADVTRNEAGNDDARDDRGGLDGDVDAGRDTGMIVLDAHADTGTDAVPFSDIVDARVDSGSDAPDVPVACTCPTGTTCLGTVCEVPGTNGRCATAIDIGDGGTFSGDVCMGASGAYVASCASTVTRVVYFVARVPTDGRVNLRVMPLAGSAWSLNSTCTAGHPMFPICMGAGASNMRAYTPDDRLLFGVGVPSDACGHYSVAFTWSR